MCTGPDDERPVRGDVRVCGREVFRNSFETALCGRGETRPDANANALRLDSWCGRESLGREAQPFEK